MKSQVLSNFNLPWLPNFVLLMFFTLFVIMLVMVYRKGSTQLYADASALPLTDGERHGRE